MERCLVDRPLRDGRCGGDAAAGLEVPDLFPTRGIDGMEHAIRAADVDQLIRDGGRPGGGVAKHRAPDLLPALPVDRVEEAILAPGVDRPVDTHRRGLGPNPGERPPLLSALGLQGVEGAVVAPDIDHAIRDSGRGRDRVARVEAPLLGPGCRVDGVEPSIAPADVEYAADDGRRGTDLALDLYMPELDRLPHRPRSRHLAGARRVAPVHRPVLAFGGDGGRRDSERWDDDAEGEEPSEDEDEARADTHRKLLCRVASARRQAAPITLDEHARGCGSSV